MEIEVFLFNLLEFEEGWVDFEIEGTPTLIHYNEGSESSRIEGAHSKRDYEEWFYKIRIY